MFVTQSRLIYHRILGIGALLSTWDKFRLTRQWKLSKEVFWTSFRVHLLSRFGFIILCLKTRISKVLTQTALVKNHINRLIRKKNIYFTRTKNMVLCGTVPGPYRIKNRVTIPSHLFTTPSERRRNGFWRRDASPPSLLCCHRDLHGTSALMGSNGRIPVLQ